MTTEFQIMKDFAAEDTTLDGAVFQSLGAASVCWESLEGTGIFQSTRAKSVGEDLLKFIHTNYVRKPSTQ